MNSLPLFTKTRWFIIAGLAFTFIFAISVLAHNRIRETTSSPMPKLPSGEAAKLSPEPMTGSALSQTTTTTRLFLHGTGSSDNHSTLFLNNIASTATSTKFKDSTSVNFNGGNSWKLIGAWNADASTIPENLTALGSMHVWLDLKNSDDQGTQFDLRAEVYRNADLVASGQTLCITGITKNPNQAKEVALQFGPIPKITLASLCSQEQKPYNKHAISNQS